MDIRRTVETALMDAGILAGDRAERLSHGKAGIQARNYKRSDYILPKFQALQVLEQLVLAEGRPSKVVPFAKRKLKAAA
jgi:hypothetical protein